MRKTIVLLLFLLAPLSANGAGDIIVNNQSTYAVPPDARNILILDLTLPENLNSIKILNLGTAQQVDISAMYIFEDGASVGWDGDENEITRKTSSPFWDVEISAVSARSRIFVTVDVASTAADKTLKFQATINSDKTVTGLERSISAGASIPDVPSAPLAKTGEAVSASTIRWNFLDLSNNEFGFRIKDSSLKTKAEIGQPNISYIDETGLFPNTCYSGRRAVAFNDRGESPTSMIFAEVCTLPTPPPAPETPIIEEPPVAPETPVVLPPVVEEPVIEEPVVEETPVPAPVVEEPVIEKPVVEEPEETEKPAELENAEEIQEPSEEAPTEKTSTFEEVKIRIFEKIRNFFSNLFGFFRR